MNRKQVTLIMLSALILLTLPTSFSLAQEYTSYSASASELFNYGKQLYKQNNLTDAQHEFEKCLLINPRHQGAQAYIEMCRQRMNTPEQITDPGSTTQKPVIAVQKPVIITRALDQAEKPVIHTKALPKRDDAMLNALNSAQENTEPARETPDKRNTTETVQPEDFKTITEEGPSVGKGAWTLKRGQFYTELYTKYYWHKHQFDSKNHKRSWDYGGKGNELSTELKLEYGFTDRITLLLYTVAKEAHWSDDFKNTTTHGFTEIRPGFKYNLFNDPFICTLQARMKFPFQYSAEAVPSLGSHQIDGELKLLTAQPWPKISSYTKVEFGFLARRGRPANQIPYFFEYGYNPRKWLTLKTTYDCVEGISQTGADEDYMKYTIGPIFKIKDLINIELGFGHTFYGENTSAAKEVFCTLSKQW